MSGGGSDVRGRGWGVEGGVENISKTSISMYLVFRNNREQQKTGLKNQKLDFDNESVLSLNKVLLLIFDIISEESDGHSIFASLTEHTTNDTAVLCVRAHSCDLDL